MTWCRGGRVGAGTEGPSSGEAVEFRPAAAVQWLLGVVGLASGILALVVGAGGAERLPLAAVLALPALLGAAVLRRRVVVRPEGLESQALLGRRVIPWSQVLRLDQTRCSFVVETSQGPVSAGWIDGRQRERLLRLVLQHAGLTLSAEPLRWGLVARYVPRARPLGFSPRGRKDLK